MAAEHDDNAPKPLAGSRRAFRPGAQVLGRSDRGESCEVSVKLRRKSALPEPDPDHPISRADLVSRYGAESSDFDTVERTLSALGLTVVAKNVAARVLRVVGPVSAAEQAFGVQLFRVKHNEKIYRGRVGDIHLPPALDGIVTGVFGLDTRPMVKHRRPLQLTAAEGQLPPPEQRTWYLPQELAAAYSFPPGDGTGQTIAILEFGGHYIAHDLKAFAQFAGLASTPSVSVKNVHNLPPQVRNDPDAIGETMLDVEVVAGVCPHAHIKLYFSQWSEQGWVDSLDAVLTDKDIPAVVSISYGLAEGDDIWTQQAITHVSDTLKELANAGLTVCVSSGDDGSDDQVPDGHAHIDFPATSPYVLSVGGTALDRASGNEVVWFDGDGLRRDHGGSGGGGVSELIPRPSWQQFDIRSVNPPGFRGRIVPDIAANAAGSTGYFMVSQNSPQVSGGTSASTPLVAGLIARMRQGGKQVGFLTPRLYRPGPKSNGQPIGAVACRDITAGTNASGTAQGYSAGPGFDAVTGWGSPIGTKLFDQLT